MIKIRMMAEKPKINKSALRADIEDRGLTRVELSSKYGLPVTQINKLVTQAGFKGKRAKTVRFELIDDEEEETSNFVGDVQIAPIEGDDSNRFITKNINVEDINL
jgi:predicted transcriptional regulator